MGYSVSDIHYADDGTWYHYSYPHQRRCFYHDGYYYVFTSSVVDSYDFIYRVSRDGTSWSTPSTGNPIIIGPIAPEDVDVFYDGTNVYLAYTWKSTWFENDVFIIKGTFSNGTITWSSAYTVYDGTGGSEWVTSPSINQTSDGYFWIAFSRKLGASWSTYCSKSSNPNDITTWAAPDTIVADFSPLQVLPLTSTTIIIIRATSSGIYAYTYDGTTVGGAETVTTQNILINGGARQSCGVVDTTGKIWVAYIDTSQNIGTAVRNGSWVDNGDLITNGTAQALALGRDFDGGLWLCYREDAGSSTFDVYIKEYDGSWQTSTQVISGEPDDNDYPYMNIIESAIPFLIFVWEKCDGWFIWLKGAIKSPSTGLGGGDIIYGSNKLDIVPIFWKENQKCDVAIRPVPNRSGPKVDTDHWMLSTRELTIRLRLSDASKTTLQTIFDNKERITLRMGTGWSYSGWLRSKPTRYEYRVVDGVLQPWLYELKLDIEVMNYNP